MTAELLVIDNYDSFTYNLVQMFRAYALQITVFRADQITVEQVRHRRPDYVVISPGPRDPGSAGISVELVRQLYRELPIFGVCLGMQSINEAFGGRTVPAPLPVHGKTSKIYHEKRGLFAGLPTSFKVARYHSLAVTDVNPALEITARTLDDVIMGLSHREFPLHGVQFHPESFLTEHGFPLIENFLKTGSLRSVLR